MSLGLLWPPCARSFLWAAAQLRELSDCLGEAQIHEILHHTPSAIELVYANALQRISARNTEAACVLFQLALAAPAQRPVSIEEALDYADLKAAHEVYNTCTNSLIQIDVANRLCFVHPRVVFLHRA